MQFVFRRARESTYTYGWKTMGNIDWTMDADRIERLVRGLNWPGTFTGIHGKTDSIGIVM